MLEELYELQRRIQTETFFNQIKCEAVQPIVSQITQDLNEYLKNYYFCSYLTYISTANNVGMNENDLVKKANEFQVENSEVTNQEFYDKVTNAINDTSFFVDLKTNYRGFSYVIIPQYFQFLWCKKQISKYLKILPKLSDEFVEDFISCLRVHPMVISYFMSASKIVFQIMKKYNTYKEEIDLVQIFVENLKGYAVLVPGFFKKVIKYD